MATKRTLTPNAKNMDWGNHMSNKQYAKFMSINGFDDLIYNTGATIFEIEGLTLAGLIRVAAFIRKQTEKVEPTVPIDKGNLRVTWESFPRMVKGSPEITFGYSSNYALWVHEMIGAHFTKPGSGAHWFKIAIERNHEEILSILEDSTKI